MHDKHGKVVDIFYGKNVNDPGWGVAVYLQMQVDEQSQANPGFGVNQPFRNAYATTAGPSTVQWTAANLLQPSIAAIPQFFSLGVGVGAAARATRLEAVQFTRPTGEFWKTANKWHDANGEFSCAKLGGNGVLIQSDLKIDDFIVSKATLSASGNYSSTDKSLIRAPYSTFQETINFVATFSGGVTPAWKFARTSVNPNSPTAAVQRDEINTLIITFGQLQSDAGGQKKPGSGGQTPVAPVAGVSLFTPLTLGGAGATQHNAATAASLYGNANRSVAP